MARSRRCSSIASGRRQALRCRRISSCRSSTTKMRSLFAIVTGLLISVGLCGQVMLPHRRASAVSSVVYTPPALSLIESNGVYNAFPGLVQLPGGNLFTVYRTGSNHVGTAGIIRYQTSTDLGNTWSSGTTLYTDPLGYDARTGEAQLLANGNIFV